MKRAPRDHEAPGILFPENDSAKAAKKSSSSITLATLKRAIRLQVREIALFAVFSSRCRLCGERIRAGVLIASYPQPRTRTSSWAHRACVESALLREAIAS